jgi:hypothetical protein
MSRPPAVRGEVRKRVLRLYRQSEPRPVILRLGEQLGRWPRTSSCGKMSLAQLLIGPDPTVVDDVAANPVLPHSRMYRILADACL